MSDEVNSRSFFKSLARFGVQGGLALSFVASVISLLVYMVANSSEQNSKDPGQLLDEAYLNPSAWEEPEQGKVYYIDLSKKTELVFGRSDDAVSYVKRLALSLGNDNEVRSFSLGKVPFIKTGVAWEIDDSLERTPAQLAALFNKEVERIKRSEEFKHLVEQGYKGYLFGNEIVLAAPYKLEM